MNARLDVETLARARCCRNTGEIEIENAGFLFWARQD